MTIYSRDSVRRPIASPRKDGHAAGDGKESNGTVVTQHNDDTVTVELLDGGLLRVSGSSAVGERVFVRDGQVEGIAPVLPSVVIEI